MRALFVLALTFLAPLAPAFAQTVQFPAWHSGRTYDATTRLVMVQTMTVAEADANRAITMDMTVDQDMRPERTDDGNWRLATTTRRMHSANTSPSLPDTLRIDTDRPESMPEPTRETMRAMIGVPIVTHLGPDLEVLRTDWPAGLDSAAAPAISATLLSGTRAVGDTWDAPATFTMQGIPLRTRTRYTLNRVAGDSAYMSMVQTFEGDGAMALPDVPPTMTATLALSGDGTGTVAVHRGNGGTHTRMRLMLRGTMTMADGGVPLPMRLTTESISDCVSTVRLRP